jgi:predicted glycosyltransferase
MNATATAPIRTVLLYAQDTRGLGHITRTLTIANHVLETFTNCVAYIVTRSKIARESTWPHRCDYVKLPSRRTPKTVQRTADDEQSSIEQFRALRSQMLHDVALGLAPDVVLVDHEPLGSSGEFKDGLWALKEKCPGTHFVFGLRDIMDDPDRIRREWQEMGVYEALDKLYDGIAVFGSPRLYDVAEAYAIPEGVRDKLYYCGYVVRDFPGGEADGIRAQYGIPERARMVVASVGSGRDGFAVLQHARAAILKVQDSDPDLYAVLVTGPFMPDEEKEQMQSWATPRCRVVPWADNFQLMAVADAAVCMGGYNTVCEGLATACPMVMVPRATHKVEQLIRAELLEAHGLARYIHPAEVTEENLAGGLQWALARDRRTQSRRIRAIFPSFEGAAQLTGYLSRWLYDD